jgi:hypothetical protein
LNDSSIEPLCGPGIGSDIDIPIVSGSGKAAPLLSHSSGGTQTPLSSRRKPFMQKHPMSHDLINEQTLIFSTSLHDFPHLVPHSEYSSFGPHSIDRVLIAILYSEIFLNINKNFNCLIRKLDSRENTPYININEINELNNNFILMENQ